MRAKLSTSVHKSQSDDLSTAMDTFHVRRDRQKIITHQRKIGRKCLSGSDDKGKMREKTWTWTQPERQAESFVTPLQLLPHLLKGKVEGGQDKNTYSMDDRFVVSKSEPILLFFKI